MPRTETASPPARPENRQRLALVVGLMFVGGLLLMLSVDAHTRITAPLGWSHDGFNGGIWGVHGRALREAPLGSVFGARSPTTGHVYVNHPPLINAAVATGQIVFGDEPSSARAVVFGATVAFLVGVFVLGRLMGAHALVAASGVAIVAGTPMLRVYGTMVDTPMLSLGVATWVLIADRLWLMRRAPLWLTPVLVVLACLASWQAVVLSAFVVLVALWRAVTGRGSRLYAASLLAAGVLATTAVLVWHAGVLGWGHLIDNLTYRSGSAESLGLGDSLRRQRQYLLDLVPAPVLLALPGLLVGLVRRRTRYVTAISTVSVLGYAILMRNGAYIHDYWNYWVLLPLAVSAVVAGDAIARVPRTTRVRGAVVAVVSAVSLLGARAGWTTVAPSEVAIESTYAFGQQLHDVRWPPREKQSSVLLLGLGSLEPAVRYYSDREVITVAAPADMSAALRSVDGDAVVVLATEPFPMMVTTARASRAMVASLS